MASNLASVAFRTARHSLQNSIKTHGAQVSIRAASASNVVEKYGTIKNTQDKFLGTDDDALHRKHSPILINCYSGNVANSFILPALEVTSSSQNTNSVNAIFIFPWGTISISTAPDETPIFKKGGAFDGILYRLTMGLCVTSLGLIGYNIITMAVKK